jgi:tryptophanyl-tRNA synthetase
MEKYKRLLTAIQPTNSITLGNYLGAIKPFLGLREFSESSFIFAADLHCLTARKPTSNLRDDTFKILAAYIAAGIDSNKTTIFVQSEVPQHAELSWILSCFTNIGELKRMHQFKTKTSDKEPSQVNVGLFSYPVLMAADILLYQADAIPVGEDQKQHIELVRNISGRLNSIFELGLVEPIGLQPKNGAKIMDLKDPNVKMSKSKAETAVLITDSPDTIMRKFKTATTDSEPEISEKAQSAGIKNLLNIQAAIKDVDYDSILNVYLGKKYGYLKKETGELVVQTLVPIQLKMNDLLRDKQVIFKITDFGGDHARSVANSTIKTIKEKLGLFVR